MNNKIVKLAVILFAVSAIVALCLGLVNGITADRIAALAKEKLDTAMKEVLPASEYTEVTYTGSDVQVDSVYQAGDAGWVVQCTVSGSQGSITMLTGINADGTVSGISVLDHGETPGLGAVAAATSDKGVQWRAQFEGVASAAVTKDGGQIEAISGATITSRAICAGVTAAQNAVKSVG